MHIYWEQGVAVRIRYRPQLQQLIRWISAGFVLALLKVLLHFYTKFWFQYFRSIVIHVKLIIEDFSHSIISRHISRQIMEFQQDLSTKAYLSDCFTALKAEMALLQVVDSFKMIRCWF